MEAFERWSRMKSVNCAKRGGMGSDGVAVGKRQCLEARREVAIEAVLEQISVQVPPFNRSKWRSLERLESMVGERGIRRKQERLLPKAEDGMVHGCKV